MWLLSHAAIKVILDKEVSNPTVSLLLVSSSFHIDNARWITKAIICMCIHMQAHAEGMCLVTWTATWEILFFHNWTINEWPFQCFYIYNSKTSNRGCSKQHYQFILYFCRFGNLFSSGKQDQILKIEFNKALWNQYSKYWHNVDVVSPCISNGDTTVLHYKMLYFINLRQRMH